eukprot:scaffold96979_cov20-Tisochrysis_lutea.AAC.4
MQRCMPHCCCLGVLHRNGWCIGACCRAIVLARCTRISNAAVVLACCAGMSDAMVHAVVLCLGELHRN